MRLSDRPIIKKSDSQIGLAYYMIVTDYYQNVAKSVLRLKKIPDLDRTCIFLKLLHHYSFLNYVFKN